VLRYHGCFQDFDLYDTDVTKCEFRQVCSWARAAPSRHSIRRMSVDHRTPSPPERTFNEQWIYSFHSGTLIYIANHITAQHTADSKIQANAFSGGKQQQEGTEQLISFTYKLMYCSPRFEQFSWFGGCRFSGERKRPNFPWFKRKRPIINSPKV